MRKSFCKIISTTLIMALFLVEMHFTSFGVSLFSYTKKTLDINNSKYYQLLENNNE